MDQMSSVSELKDRIGNKTLNIVLLSIATAGIYPLLWLWRNVRVINEVTGHQTATDVYLIWMAVCAGLSGVFAGNEDLFSALICLGLSVALAVLYIVWAFAAKRALQDYALTRHGVDLRMNGFYTFLFTAYYINYCINDLPEAKRKQEILSSRLNKAT
jgi:hypothetical protein